jgi:hypothetical protein
MRTGPYPVVARDGWAPEEDLGPAHLVRQMAMEPPTPQALPTAVGRARTTCEEVAA